MTANASIGNTVETPAKISVCVSVRPAREWKKRLFKLLCLLNGLRSTNRMRRNKEIKYAIVSLVAECFFTIQWIKWRGKRRTKANRWKKEYRIFISFDGSQSWQKIKWKQRTDKSLLFDKNKWKLLKMRSGASLSVWCALWCDTFRCIMRWHTTDAQRRRRRIQIIFKKKSE